MPLPFVSLSNPNGIAFFANARGITPGGSCDRTIRPTELLRHDCGFLYGISAAFLEQTCITGTLGPFGSITRYC